MELSGVSNEAKIKQVVQKEIIRQMIKSGRGYFIPAAISARHVHLSNQDVESLFGKGYKLKRFRDLSQPGQYACEEQVTLVGPKGNIEKMRVLGPERRETQVEISFTDSFKVGIKSVVRMSGSDLEGTPGGKLIGPAGEVTLKRGVIIAARHLHMSADEADMFGLKNGDKVKVKKAGEREIIFGNVVVRCGDGHSLEMHIDTDEANAAGMMCGELLELIK
jgi:putative phosphotransacetylase